MFVTTCDNEVSNVTETRRDWGGRGGMSRKSRASATEGRRDALHSNLIHTTMSRSPTFTIDLAFHCVSAAFSLRLCYVTLVQSAIVCCALSLIDEVQCWLVALDFVKKKLNWLQ